jgi:hypothetical protein
MLLLTVRIQPDLSSEEVSSEAEKNYSKL